LISLVWSNERSKRFLILVLVVSWIFPRSSNTFSGPFLLLIIHLGLPFLVTSCYAIISLFLLYFIKLSSSNYFSYNYFLVFSCHFILGTFSGCSLFNHIIRFSLGSPVSTVVKWACTCRLSKWIVAVHSGLLKPIS